MMNLYILNNVLIGCGAGMATIVAETQEDCKKIYEKAFPSSIEMKEFDNARITVIENVNYPKGVISYVYGGG